MKRHILLNGAAALLCFSLAMPARADGLNAGSTDKLALNVPADAVVIALGGIAALVPEIFNRSSARRIANGVGRTRSTAPSTTSSPGQSSPGRQRTT